MITSFVHSFQSEWLKKRRSAAVWLVLIGGFLIPVIMLIVRFTNFDRLAVVNGSDKVWDSLYHGSWRSMGLFLLPMGVILATSLVTQLEFRNNAWKQLHTTPQSLSTIFFAKLAVILVMLMQFFILFNVGIYLVGVIPSFFNGVPYPKQSYTPTLLLKQNYGFIIACLPIVALQYLLSLQFKNFLLPIGAGLGLLVASLIAVNWKHGYSIPYTYCSYNFLGAKVVPGGANIMAWSLGYFVVFTGLAYFLYIKKGEKG